MLFCAHLFINIFFLVEGCYEVSANSITNNTKDNSASALPQREISSNEIFQVEKMPTDCNLLGTIFAMHKLFYQFQHMIAYHSMQ